MEESAKGFEGSTENATQTSHQELLKGKTFKIYWYLLTHGETGIRELQRNLDFSSTNLVSHHLKKLIDANLVKQNPDHGKYEIKQEIKTGVLSLYTRVGRYLIPQNMFLFAFFLTMTVCYIVFLILSRGKIIPEDTFFLLITLIGMSFFLRQTLKIWRLKPL
ncbi:MAG: winged helix-turn-helix domain-containing protein [Candidatus Hodarchaeales archaeon]|jgi:hypothetical protein